MSAIELERKFLVDVLPEGVERNPSEPINQGYLVVGEDASEVRVRRRGERTFLTVKQGTGRARREEEIEIPRSDFDRLWPLSEGRRIEKTRYRIPAPGDLVIELDVYDGSLAGLKVAEVEFDSGAAAERFAPPPWFGREVTEDDAYKNRRLAVDGRPGD